MKIVIYLEKRFQIFRNIISKKNNYSNYNDFFIKNIIDKQNLNILLDFNTFISKIPSGKKILDIKTKNASFNLNINISEVINFLASKLSKITVENTNNKYIIKNNKYGGKIIICFDSTIGSIEFNNYQINYSLIHFNTDEIKNLNFLKNTSSFIEIKLNSQIIKDLSSLLDIIHLLTISIKMIESYPNDIYECIYPIDYTNYYFLSFCMFFEFIKPNIKTSLSINKFIIDLFKYFYIYSYYDYYFYYSNNLFETIMTTYHSKNNIFEDFVNNLKNLLKLPKELFAYPPFFDIEDDLNSLIYYSFEIPNYFKLFDFVNAICYVFDKNYYSNNNNNKNINFSEIIQKYFIFSPLESNSNPNTNPNTNPNINNKTKINTNKNGQQIISSESLESSDSLIDTQISEKPNIKKNNKSSKLLKTKSSSDLISESVSISDSDYSDDLKSRLKYDQISNLSKKEKKLMHNTNTYIELNIENSVNYELNTDIN